MAFDRFNDKPERRERRFEDRPGRGDKREFPRDDRKGFGERRGFAGDRTKFGGERRFDGERRFGGERPKFGGRRDAGGFDAARRSGPRAKAFEVRRFNDRNAFVQTATVRLDADVFEHFKTAEDVNAALRQVIALAGLVRTKAPAAEEVPAEPVQEDAAADLTASSDEDE